MKLFNISVMPNQLEKLYTNGKCGFKDKERHDKLVASFVRFDNFLLIH